MFPLQIAASRDSGMSSGLGRHELKWNSLKKKSKHLELKYVRDNNGVAIQNITNRATVVLDDAARQDLVQLFPRNQVGDQPPILDLGRWDAFFHQFADLRAQVDPQSRSFV